MFSVAGRLMECIKTRNKEKTKDYFSLVLYDQGQTVRVGVNLDTFLKHQNNIDQVIVLDNVRIWCEGRSSYFIPDSVED